MMTLVVDNATFVPGVIRVHGIDAATFLRAQLTNDVGRLGTDRNFLAAWCDAKGRTLMICRIVAISAEEFLLVLPRTMLDSTLKRLQMYVLRAKVKLLDASDDYRLTGELQQTGAPAANETRVLDNHWHIGLPPTVDGTARTLVVKDSAAPPSGNGLTLDCPAWERAAIDAGVPQIEASTAGQFVPQMLNLHWLGAIDFSKGCYPGQEIIARLHYRGRLVRRVFRLSYEGAPPAIGSALTPAENDTRAGTVLRVAAPSDDGEPGVLLAVLDQTYAAAPLVTERHGTTAPLDLPYPTPD